MSLSRAKGLPPSQHPAAREGLEFRYRGGLLARGKFAPPRTEPGLAGQLRDQDTVRLNALIDHEFEYYIT